MYVKTKARLFCHTMPCVEKSHNVCSCCMNELAQNEHLIILDEVPVLISSSRLFFAFSSEGLIGIYHNKFDDLFDVIDDDLCQSNV